MTSSAPWGIDHLVFTASGRVQPGELSETNGEQARHVLDLRFRSVVMAAKCGSSQIRLGGSIVRISSVIGRRPRKGWGKCLRGR